jgi:hypothetical protein
MSKIRKFIRNVFSAKMEFCKIDPCSLIFPNSKLLLGAEDVPLPACSAESTPSFWPMVDDDGSWPHSQLCSSSCFLAAVEATPTFSLCPISSSESECTGDGGRDPIGEETGVKSGSLK